MMNPRLRLVMQLLFATCASSVLGSPGCDQNCEDDRWAPPIPYGRTTGIDIRGAVTGGSNYDAYAVGAGGEIIGLDAYQRIAYPVDVELRAITITYDVVVAVGADATVVVGTRGEDTWEASQLDTTAELRSVGTVSVRGIDTTYIVGDGVMFEHEPSLGRWTPVPAPPGGWGDLLAIGGDGDGGVIAIGRGGVVWTTSSSRGPWTREDAGSDADLWTISPLSGAEVFVAGADGTLLARHPTDGWRTIAHDLGVDILDLATGVALAADGRVFLPADDGGFDWDPVAELGPGPRVLVHDSVYQPDIVALGDDGTHQFVRDRCGDDVGFCSGRPFMVDAVARTAPVVDRADWCAPPSPPPNLSPETGAALAQAWTTAAQDEHASIAAFAGALLELMSLGAPPELLLATRAALADEVEHTRLCFAQARRHGATACGPGPLAVAGALARAGDPAAIALAVFDEGCIGEGASAAVAAIAAAACQDPEARAVLEILAHDEAQHAALAWRTLRWLVDHHGDAVAIPLRERLASLGSPRMTDDGPDLRSHGWLSARERSTIHREPLRSVVRPLAAALLAASPGSDPARPARKTPSLTPPRPAL